MVFATVGNATQNSKRLLSAMDHLACSGAFGQEEILVQYGNNIGFRSHRCICQDFLTVDQFNSAVHRADVVVCHAGSGTILHVLETGKVPVVVPRLIKYGEVIDDHQVELTGALSESRRIIAVMEICDLQQAIAKARTMRFEPHYADKTALAALVSVAIEDLAFHGHTY